MIKQKKVTPTNLHYYRSDSTIEVDGDSEWIFEIEKADWHNYLLARWVARGHGVEIVAKRLSELKQKIADHINRQN